VSSYRADIVSPSGLYANVPTGMRSRTPRNEVGNSITSIGQSRLLRRESYETGVTARMSSKLLLLGAVWRADNSIEIRGIPPRVDIESLGRSRRYGVERGVSWYPRARPRLYGGLSFGDVRPTTPTTPTANHLPDVPEYLHKLGVEFHTVRQGNWSETLSVSSHLTFNEPRDLNTTIRTDRYQRVTASVAHTTRRYRGVARWNRLLRLAHREAAFRVNQRVGVRANPHVSLEGGIAYRF
jgi:hypothetical protein